MRTTRNRSIRTLLAGALAAGSVALVLPASPVQAADVTVTVVDADGNPVERAMVAVVDSDGVALAGAIADENGDVDIDNADGASYVVSAPGYETFTATGVLSDAQEITLNATAGIAMTYSNAYGAQVSGVFADGEPGVFYITTDGIPSVWRTMDYAGTWVPVPTTAFSDDGLPQGGAGGLTTSGYPGEVAVVINNSLWYSTDFGTTWNSLAFPQGSNIAQPEVRWAHSETSTDAASVILVASMATGQEWAASAVYAADMTAPEPQLTALGNTVLPSSGLLDIVGAGGSVFLFRASSATDVAFGELSLGGSGWVLSGGGSISGLQLASAPDAFDSMDVLSLGGSVPDVVALFEHTVSGANATGKLEVAYYDSSWTVFDNIVGQDDSTGSINGGSNWNDLTDLYGTGGITQCGVNNTATAISIAPTAGKVDFAGFEAIGTVGTCMWALNATGSNVTYPGASSGTPVVSAGLIANVVLDGINNNTGFAWSAGYNFSNDATTGDMVAIAPNEAGIAKSANIPGHRPEFVGRGARDRNNFISNLAGPGTATTSGGIAINGLTAAVVRDIAMDPNDATGQNFALITSPGGGSRVMLTTDGGESFSTVTGSGGESMAWWNGDDIEMMAAFSTLDGGLLVKAFNRDSGAGAAEMGDELAKTAANREADSTGFAFPSDGLRPSSPINGVNTYMGALAAGNTQVSAMTGVAGTNYVLVGGSAVQSGGGSVDATYASGSVALMELQVNSTTNAVTVADVTVYGGSGTTGQDPTAADTRGLYTNGGVTSITYCPVGSGAAVADKAFITVKGASGGGLYVLDGVSSGTPTHSAISAAAALGLGKLRVDCATGFLAAVAPATQSNPPQPGGVYISTDAATFVQVNLPTPPSTLDVQADEETGEITLVIAGGNGDVTSVEMTEEDLGIDLTDVKAGDETTPTQPIDPPEDGVTPLNDSAEGINTGGIADIELPPSEGDVALEEDVAAASVRRSMKARADETPISIGSASGAFAASVGTGNTGGTDGTGSGSTFIALTPKRLLDTRSGDKVGELDGSGSAYELQVTGKGGVPSSGVSAVALNVTAVSTETNDFGGFVTVYPCGTRPDASNLNFTSGMTIPNSVIAPVSSSGKVCFYVYGKAHLLADVSGYMGS